MTGLSAASPEGYSGRRLRVLSLPSATTLSLIVLAVAMLAAGLFVGTALYNSLFGASWIRDVEACMNNAPAGAASSEEVQLSCAAPGEHQRAMIAVAVTTIIGLVAVATVVLAPRVLCHRRRLRPGVGFDAAKARLAELALGAGVRVPALMVGPAAQRDAFCFGRPGRYVLALPKALAIRPGLPVFEAVVRHELAHIAHHDVALSWLARSIWYALAPALALPLALFAAHGDLKLTLDYLWRAVVFATVILLVQSAVLRAREHDADLRACDGPGVEPVLMGVLAGLRPPVASPARRLLAVHPDGSQRRRAIQQPERVTQLTAVDGLTVGFLATLTLPLLGSIFGALVLSNPNAFIVTVAGTLVIGPLLGATLGVALWRQAVVARAAGTQSRVVRVVLGVLIGAVLGQAVSFDNVGLGSLTGTEHPLAALGITLAMGGATVLLAGLGELWAGAAGRIRRPAGVWVPAAMLAALLYAGVLWAADIVQHTWDQAEWALASQLPSTILASAPMALLVVVLAIAAGWALRSASCATPGWLLPGAAPAPLSGPRLGPVVLAGLSGGVAAGLVLGIYQAIAGLATGNEELVRRVFAYQWAAGAAGSAVLLGLYLLCGRRGSAAGLLAAPVAAGTVVVIFFILSGVHGGSLTLGDVSRFTRAALVLGLLLSVSAALLTFGTGGRHSGRPARTVLICLLAIPLAAAVATAAVLGQNILVPVATDALSPGARPPDYLAEDLFYEQDMVPALANVRTRLGPVLDAIIKDPSTTPQVKAQLLRTQVIAPLSQSLASAQTFHSADAAVNNVHRHVLIALQYSVNAYQTIAQGLEMHSSAMLQQGITERNRANSEWHTWVLGAAALPR